jgi:putative flippase GtrA
LYSSSLSIPPYVNPLALIAIMTAFILNPTKTFRHEARFWALKVLVSWLHLINILAIGMC